MKQLTDLEKVDRKEKLEIFDTNLRKVGEKTRKQVHIDGDIHKGLHVYLFNSNGELLLQKRSQKVTTYKGKWHLSLGGHLTAGDDIYETAISELKEELDMDVEINELETIGILYDESYNKELNFYDRMYLHVFCAVLDESRFNLNVKNEEVEELKFVSLSEYKEMITNQLDIMIPHSNGLGTYYNAIYYILQMYLDRKNISYN